MKRRPPCLCLFAVSLFAAAYAPLLLAQEAEAEPKPTEVRGAGRIPNPFAGILPDFRDRALVLEISARIVEQNQEVNWHEAHQQVTIHGRPVALKLVGSNVVVAMQLTPYLRRKGKNLLVAQGQVWVDIPNQGIRYQTTMQTIPLDFNEPVYFFPLGQMRNGGAAFIEVILTMHPYTEAAVPPEDEAQGEAPASPPEDSR